MSIIVELLLSTIRLLDGELVGGESTSWWRFRWWRDTGKKKSIKFENHFGKSFQSNAQKIPHPGCTLLPSTKFDLCSGFLVN